MKCPRIVTERYKCARTGETKTRTYVRGRPLGKGGFAVVYGMQDPSTGENFAAKVVAKSTLEKERARAKILTEIRIHRGCDNAHVVRFVRCFEDAANVYILMELCSNRTLADVVKARGRLTEPECAAYAREIVTAVAHLHAHRVIHRDLKLGNLFLTPAGLDEATGGGGEDSSADRNERGGGGASAGGGPGSDPALDDSVTTGGRLKIGDFGLACRVESDDERKTTICGTPNYIAPEVLAGSKGGGHSYEVDVWSIGVIIYTLLVGTPPFQTSDVHATYKRIRANAYEFPEGVVNEGARELIRGCLAPKPGDRPKIADIAAHPLLNAGWRGATPWSMPTPRVDMDKMERSTKSSTRSAGGSAPKPKAPATSAGGRSRRAPLSPLTVADPSAARTGSLARNVNDATPTPTPPPATPAPFDVLDSDVVGSTHLARTPETRGEVPAAPAAGPPRRAAEEGACGAAALESRVASMRLTTEAPVGGDAEEDSLAAAEAGRRKDKDGVRPVASTSAPVDPAEFATLGMDSPSVGFGRAAAPGSNAPGNAPGNAPASLESFPPLWVTRWVDYTSKYGLGYVLSDGTFGVVFNDATKMTQSALDTACDDVDGGAKDSHAASPDTTTAHLACHDGAPGDRLEYRERARRREGADASERRVAPPPACFRASTPCPAGLEKKVKLMRHFRGYLSSDGRSAVERSSGGLGEAPGLEARHPRAVDATREALRGVTREAEAASDGTTKEAPLAPYLPHVKNWLRTKHAVLFRLSNRTIQVCFQDGSEVLLSSEASACVFTSKAGARMCHSLAALPQDPELLRRLRYVKEVLHQLVSRA